MKPIISVITPVYNSELYLKKCLDSLKIQTMENIEFICINDGSSDNSRMILDDYAKKDKRFRVFHKDNEGVSQARNFGLSKAVGDYIMFLDSDDWYEMDTCRKAYSLVRGYDLAAFAMSKEYEKKSEAYYAFGNQNRSFDKVECNKIHRTLIGLINEECNKILEFDYFAEIYLKIYKRDIIEKHNLRFFDIRKIGSFEDGFFNIQYFEYVKKMNYSSDILYHYRKTNDSSIITKYKPEFDCKWKYLFDLIENYIVQIKNTSIVQGRYEEYIHAFNNRRAFSILGLGLNAVASNEKFLAKYNHIQKLLNDKVFGYTFSKEDIKYMPIHFKVFFGFASIKNTFGVYILLEIMQGIRRYRRNNW